MESYYFKEKEFFYFAKRLFDIFSSGMVLICFGWFILLLFFIKFCENGHDPIYTSIRVGKNGQKHIREISNPETFVLKISK